MRVVTPPLQVNTHNRILPARRAPMPTLFRSFVLCRVHVDVSQNLPYAAHVVHDALDIDGWEKTYHYCLGAPPAHIFSASSVTAVKDGSVEVESMARYPAAGPVVATHAQCRCLDALDEHDTLDLAAIARVLCDHSPRSVPRPFTHNESSRSFSRVPRAASPSRKCAQSTVVYQRSAFPRTVSRAVVHQNSIRLSLRTLDHWGLVGMNEPAEPFVGTRGHLPITHTSSK